MKKIALLLTLVFFCIILFPSIRLDTVFLETEIILQTSAGHIFGTLTTPENSKKISIAMMISGSGTIDRDGNNPMMKNNSMKMLPHELSQNGIAQLEFQ